MVWFVDPAFTNVAAAGLKRMKIGESGTHITGSTTMVRPMMIAMMMAMMFVADAVDTNGVFSPCADAQVRKSDGFTFGLAFSSKESFFFNQAQLSPCDRRLSLASKNAQLALFRPKVDQTSFLTIDSTTFNPGTSGGYMVAFAGQKYAARSTPILVADDTHVITSITLVLEFQRGTLQNLFWKSNGCAACPGDSVCLNSQQCAVPTPKCIGNGGPGACNLSIQLTFSGTDKNLVALNSWYEVENLRRYSLHDLFQKIHDPIAGH